MSEKNKELEKLTDSQKLNLILEKTNKISDTIDEFLQTLAKREDKIDTPTISPADGDKYDSLPWHTNKKGGQYIQIQVLRTLADPVGNDLLAKIQAHPFDTDAFNYKIWRMSDGTENVTRWRKRK